MKLFALLFLFNLSAVFGQNMDLRNPLTADEYKQFRKAITSEWQKNPNIVGDQARTMLIGMLGLEDKPEAQRIFDFNPDYNVNTLLLVIANYSKIKLEKPFISNYQEQLEQLKKRSDVDTRAIAAGITEYLIAEQEKLP
jgi:hypothetical protein